MNPSFEPPTFRPSPTPPPKGFKLSPVSFVVAIVGMAAAVIGNLVQDSQSTYGVSRAMGAAIGVLFFPALIAVIAYYVAGRSSRVANIAFVILALVAAAGQLALVATRVNHSKNSQVFRQLEQDNRQSLDQINKEANEKGYLDDAEKMSADSVKRLEDASKNLSGVDSLVAKAGAAVTRRLSEYGVPHNASVKGVIEAGGLDLSGIRTGAEAQKRLALFEELGRTNDALLKFLRGISGVVQEEMQAAGVPNDKIGKITADFLVGMKRPQLVSLREDDEKLVAAARDYFGVLIDNDGNWEIAGDGSVMFGEDVPEGDVQRFNDAAVKAQTVATHQQQVLDALRR